LDFENDKTKVDPNVVKMQLV